MLVCYSMPWTVHTVNSAEHRSQGRGRLGLPIVVCRRTANVVAIRRVYWAQNIPKTHLQLAARSLPWTHQRKLTVLPWPPSWLWGHFAAGGEGKERKGREEKGGVGGEGGGERDKRKKRKGRGGQKGRER